MGGIEVKKCVIQGSGGVQTLSGIFGNEGFFGPGSMVLMWENVFLHVVGLPGDVGGLRFGTIWKHLEPSGGM